MAIVPPPSSPSDTLVLLGCALSPLPVLSALTCFSSLHVVTYCCALWFVAAVQLPDMFKAVLSSPPSHSEPGAPAPEGVKDRRLDSEAPLLSSSGEDLRPYLRPCAPSSQQPSTQEAAGPNQHAGAESRGKGGWTAAWPAAHTPGLNARPAAPGSGCQWLPGGSAATANSWAWAVVVTVAVVVLAGFEVVGKRPWRFRAWHQTAAPISPSLSLLDDSPASSRCSSFSAAPGGRASL